jgi:tetrahydromethanopterin S-methyltransferase subunit E
MDWLRILGDALWIVSLAMVASSALNAARHVESTARVPLIYRKSGPGLRLPRNLAFAVNPLTGLAVGMILVWAGWQAGPGADAQLISFGVRATVAALFALGHMYWMKAAMEALAAEGQLRP